MVDHGIAGEGVPARPVALTLGSWPWAPGRWPCVTGHRPGATLRSSRLGRFLGGASDGRAGEADERGFGQGVAHHLREAADEVVLATVDLDDPAPVAMQLRLLLVADFAQIDSEIAGVCDEPSSSSLRAAA